jgi:hypothetical protein
VQRVKKDIGEEFTKILRKWYPKPSFQLSLVMTMMICNMLQSKRNR